MTSPLACRLAAGIRPMIVRQVTVFPQPLSPTMPSISASCTVSDTPSTARTTPWLVAR